MHINKYMLYQYLRLLVEAYSEEPVIWPGGLQTKI